MIKPKYKIGDKVGRKGDKYAYEILEIKFNKEEGTYSYGMAGPNSPDKHPTHKMGRVVDETWERK